MSRTIETMIAGIVLEVFREFDYLLSAEEVSRILDHIQRKADGVYEPWSRPYLSLAEDEFRNYVFRNRITELTCSAIE